MNKRQYENILRESNGYYSAFTDSERRLKDFLRDFNISEQYDSQFENLLEEYYRSRRDYETEADEGY